MNEIYIAYETGPDSKLTLSVKPVAKEPGYPQHIDLCSHIPWIGAGHLCNAANPGFVLAGSGVEPPDAPSIGVSDNLMQTIQRGDAVQELSLR